MDIKYYLAWICLIHLTLFAIILFTKKANRQANRMLGIFMLIFAYMHLGHLFLITNTVVQYHFLNELGFLTLFFLGPVYLQYASYLTGIKIAWKKYFVLHALPFVPPVLFVISFFLKTDQEIKNYYDIAALKEPFDMRAVLSIVSIQMGVYMIWSLKLVNRYNLNLAMRNTSSALSLKWLKLLTIFMLILSFIIAPALIVIIKSDTTALFVYMPAITLIIYFLLFIKSMNFPSTEEDKNIVRTEDREKTSRDLHDDLGSGLSKIFLIAENSKKYSDGNQTLNENIHSISKTSKELVDNMRDMIWMLNSESITLENLISRMHEYSGEYLEEFPVKNDFIFPEEIPNIIISKEAHRNIFLVFKEALNNSVKHSGADTMEISVKTNDHHLKIFVSDNGKGFSAEQNKKSGNGLRNMNERITSIGGKFNVDSSQEKGTVVSIAMSLGDFSAKQKN